MNNLDELIKTAHKNLYETDIVKEYFRLRDLLKNNEELASIEKEMKEHERLMTLNIMNDEEYKKEKEEYEKCRSFIDNHPLVNDFHEVETEVYNLLKEIKEILE